MNPALSRRISLFVWLLIPAVAAALWFIPVSNRFTKVAALVVAALAWRGVLALAWPHRILRWVLPSLTLAAGVFLFLPPRWKTTPHELRDRYTAALREYDGVTYVWGGESRRGIDCSGLIRCGLMNALLRDGLRTADPGPVREALSLWWNDTSAKALGEEHAGLTQLLFTADSINTADHTRLAPGDLAVTQNGVHILAHLGDGEWIQADPGPDRVVRSQVPVSGDGWFQIPVKFLRWRVLGE